MEDGIAEKVVMFVHYIVAFIGSLVLAFIKGWQLSLVCLTSLPVTLISLSLVTVVSNSANMDSYMHTYKVFFFFALPTGHLKIIEKGVKRLCCGWQHCRGGIEWYTYGENV